MADEKDLYAVLGTAKNASQQDLRRTYRKLARKYHPDVNPGNKRAEERFKEISAAYDVLSNPEKRKLYDEFGMAGLREGFDPARAREYQRWAQGRDATRGGGATPEPGFEFDLGDLFGDLGDVFGGARRGGGGGGGAGGGGSGRRRRGTAERSRSAAGQDLLATVEIDLAQALSGTEVQLEVPTPETCSRCGGTGDEPGTSETNCPDCGGTGRRQVVRGPMRMMSTCPTCGGRGRLRTPCSQCSGDGVVAKTEPVTVRVPAGADNGSRLRVAGRGAAAPGGGGQRGDLVIETRIRPHPFFRREGLDLFLRLPVTLAEAYDGASVEVPTPTGTVKLKVPPGSQQGTELRLRGRGVRKGRQQGDLYVTVDVRLPERDDPRVHEALRTASEAYARPVRDGIRL